MQIIELTPMSIGKEQEKENLLSIGRTCSALGISRDGYYKWMKRKQSPNLQNSHEMDIKSEIQKIAVEFPY